MRIAVMGAGGIGGYFGARLALSGSDVTFIARGLISICTAGGMGVAAILEGVSPTQHTVH